MAERLNRIQQREIDQQIGEAYGKYKAITEVFKATMGNTLPTDFSGTETMLAEIPTRKKRLATANLLYYLSAEMFIRYWNPSSGAETTTP